MPLRDQHFHNYPNPSSQGEQLTIKWKGTSITLCWTSRNIEKWFVRLWNLRCSNRSWRNLNSHPISATWTPLVESTSSTWCGVTSSSSSNWRHVDLWMFGLYRCFLSERSSAQNRGLSSPPLNFMISTPSSGSLIEILCWCSITITYKWQPCIGQPRRVTLTVSRPSSIVNRISMQRIWWDAQHCT